VEQLNYLQQDSLRFLEGYQPTTNQHKRDDLDRLDSAYWAPL
jgi:hypothetical protein